MKKLHKYIGLVFILVMVWMAVSGIVLNHRQFFSGCDISRNMLPGSYAYNNWNYGFFKGSVNVGGDSVLLYGNEGVWLSNQANDFVKEFNRGIKKGADNLKISRVVVTTSGEVYCAALFDLYKLEGEEWKRQKLPGGLDRLTDLEAKGDSVLLLTRSELLLKTSHDSNFSIQYIAASPDVGEKRSLFRILWDLHGGKLYGTTGKIVVDLLAALFVFLSVSGLFLYLLPKIIKRKKRKEKDISVNGQQFRFFWKWHNKLGYWLTIPLLVVVITGMFLRPPLLIAIVRKEVTPPPFSEMRSENKWKDMLRVIRYDEDIRGWLLYTSEGFFSMADLTSPPLKLRHQPPASVMGVNVLQRLDKYCWIVGSFNGLVVWALDNGNVIDCFTNQPYVPAGRMPFGNRKISGFTTDFKDKTIAFDYDRGVHVFEHEQSFKPMPAEYASRSMSWWNLALEMHTGRIFTFMGIYHILLTFVTGILSTLLLISGWVVYRKIVVKKKRKSSK